MHIRLGRVFIARDVKFDDCTLYQQLLKIKPITFAFEQAEPDTYSEIEDEVHKLPNATPQPPKAMIQSPKAKIHPLKATALPRAINPIDDSDDDLTPPPETPHPETPPAETPPPKPSRSGSNAAIVSIAMMIEQGTKTCRAALDAETSVQWEEAIGKEVASMESHEVFTFVQKVREGASIIGSCWVMGRKVIANGTIDRWKVRLVGRGDHQYPGDYNDITSPVIDSASIRLALGLAAKHDFEMAVLDIPTAFLGCPLHETLYMRLPEGEWRDPYGHTRPLVKLKKTWYAIKQANRKYYEEVFDFIVDDLNLHASIAAPGLFFGGNLEANSVLISVYVNDIMIIGKSVLVASIASPLYDRLKAAGQVPVPDTFQYLGMTVTRDRSK